MISWEWFRAHLSSLSSFFFLADLYFTYWFPPTDIARRIFFMGSARRSRPDFSSSFSVFFSPLSLPSRFRPGEARAGKQKRRSFFFFSPPPFLPHLRQWAGAGDREIKGGRGGKSRERGLGRFFSTLQPGSPKVRNYAEGKIGMMIWHGPFLFPLSSSPCRRARKICVDRRNVDDQGLFFPLPGWRPAIAGSTRSA